MLQTRWRCAGPPKDGPKLAEMSTRRTPMPWWMPSTVSSEPKAPGSQTSNKSGQKAGRTGECNALPGHPSIGGEGESRTDRTCW